MAKTDDTAMHPMFAAKIEAWRTLKPGCRVRVKDHPLEQSAKGQQGVFIEYTSQGYARVDLEPKPGWADQTPVRWLLHPESLEVIA